jgi:hypothetical protein
VSAGTCEIEEGGVRCADPGVSTWHAACVHEHVSADIAVCAGHEWRMTSTAPWKCLVCEKGAEAHSCAVLVSRAVPA